MSQARTAVTWNQLPFTFKWRTDLGGHLKTGHAWTLQKRPTERNQDNSSYTLPERVRAIFFTIQRSRAVYTNKTWAEGTATQGCDRSADPAAGMAGRRKPPLHEHSGAKR